MQVLTTKEVSANPQSQLNVRVVNKCPVIAVISTELLSQNVEKKNQSL